MQHLPVNHDDWSRQRGDYVFGLVKNLTPLPTKEVQEHLDALIESGLISKQEADLIQGDIAMAPEIAIANKILRKVLSQPYPDGFSTKAPKRVKRDGPPRPKRPRPTSRPDKA